jgi:hypothetical protein
LSLSGIWEGTFIKLTKNWSHIFNFQK